MAHDQSHWIPAVAWDVASGDLIRWTPDGAWRTVSMRTHPPVQDPMMQITYLAGDHDYVRKLDACEIWDDIGAVAARIEMNGGTVHAR